MDFTIRQTKEDDYEAVFALVHDSGVSLDFTEQQFRSMLRRTPECYYVAEADDQVVGNVFGMHDGAFRGYIGSLVVAEPYRRRGIAKALVKELIGVYESLGLKRIFAQIEKTNEASLGLFRSLGMNPSETHYVVDNLH